MNRYEKENAKLVMGMKILAAIIISLSVAKCAVKKVNTSSNKHITNKKEMHKGLMYGRKVSSLKQHKNTQSEVIQQPKVDGLTGKPLPEKVKKAASVRKVVKKAAPVRKVVKKAAPVRKAVKKAAPVRKAVKRHKHKKPYRRTKAKDPKKDWRLRHMYGNTKTW